MRKARGHVLFSKIYLRRDLFQKFAKGKVNPELISVLEHEVKHIERGKRNGSLRWSILYWLSRKHRFQEELHAIKEEMKILKKAGKNFDFDKRARYLSGLLYLWAAPYKQVHRELTKLWEKI